MESKRPQLNLSELHQLKWLLGTVLALLAAWTVPFMGIEATGLLTLLTGAAVVVVWRPKLVERVPGWANRMAFPLLLAVALGDYLLGPAQDILPPLIRLTLMLLLYRVVTPRRPRDDLQVIVLGLFLVVVAGVLSVSIMFAAQILVFTGCALLFLLVITLTEAATGPTARPSEWTQVNWRALARRVRAVANWRVVLLGSGLFAGLVAVSSIFFLLLPRFDLESSVFLSHMMQGKSKTGFSEEVTLGGVTDIQNDDGIAFRVDVSDPAQVPVQVYWRMLVLDKYADGNFSMSNGLKNSLHSALNNEKVARFVGNGMGQAGTPVWTFYFEPGTSRYLPLPGNFYQIVFAEPQDIAGNAELGVVSLRAPAAKMFPYRMDRVELTATYAASANDPSADRGTALPKRMMPDYRSLGTLEAAAHAADAAKLREWALALGAADNTAEFAKRACAWLAQRHSYAMQVTVPSGKEAPQDPVVNWLNGTLPGHCEYFAGGFVLLARAAGIPARMVVGFKGGKWNPLSKNLVVRNKDAHAWCEIYDAQQRGWLRVDPTVGSSVFGERAEALRGEEALRLISEVGLSARFDSLRVFWYRRIVSFDQVAQAELARSAQQAVQDYGRSLKAFLHDRLVELRHWGEAPWDWRRLALSVGGIALLILVVRWWHWARLKWLCRRGADPVRREAGYWLVRLSACDSRRLPNARELGEAKSQMQITGVERRKEIGGELERLRYGAAQTWPDPALVFRRARQFWRES